MASQLISLVGWTFLPDFATQLIQSTYYQLTIRAGEPKPLPRSASYNADRQRIYFLVVSAYLLLTIYEADWEIQRKQNFHQVLGVPFTATDKEVKSRFRRLAALYHPDKLATSSLSTEANFVHLKLAQDVLLNPVKRFAYERFGPDMLEWKRCFSMRDYLVQGLQSIIPYYCGAALFMCIFGILGYIKNGTFWRWLAITILCIFELHTISKPHFPLILTNFLNPILLTLTNHPPYLPFQLIQLLRKTSVTFFIALSHLGPLFANSQTEVHRDVELKKSIDNLEFKARTLDLEASRLLNLEMTPFFHDNDTLALVEQKMKEWLIQNTIRMDPAVRGAFSNALQNKRTDESTGVSG